MKFNYQARDQKGQTQQGVIEASSKEAALQILGRDGLYVTLLEEPKAQPFYAKRIAFFDKVSSKEIMLFSRQLSILFKSQVPLMESLRTLSLQAKNQNFKEKIIELSEDVEGGTPFSQAIAKFPKIFSSYFVSMVKSGESSGSLSEVLESLANHEEREYELSSKVRSALTYPAFVVSIGIVVLFLMMVFVIPNLTRILEGSSQELPFATKLILSLSGFLQAWWWVLLIGIVSTIFGVSKYLGTKEGKELFDEQVLKMPGIGSFLRMMYLGRFAENLSTLVAGGIPIVQALEITQDILGNQVYKRILEEAKESVKKGDPISQVLQKYPQEFPPIFTQMMNVGERSGTMDTTMLYIVKYYQKEVANSVESFLSILEPMLIVVLGVLVGGMMAAILLPMYQSVSV
ncbi:MAG: type II secretion system F family protein [Candidatus Wildermuthbacteria bacterium]|nr:type II secretion system F family protein [Candidatus Wildermuthbacteria bacterium]